MDADTAPPGPGADRAPRDAAPAARPPAGLPAAALRALAEAEARRRAAPPPAPPPEVGGRDGPDPVRYGDWERRGLAIDF